MNLNTEDKLFEHACQIKDMKLSGFNPHNLVYYCQECGGKLVLNIKMEKWKDFFGEPISLRLTKRVVNKIEEEREKVSEDSE